MSLRLFLSAIVFVGLSGSAQAGFLEVCKDSVPLDSLGGLFSFTIAGQSGTFEAPVGACTSAIELPDGEAVISEVPQEGAMLFSIFTFPEERLISFDLSLGTATVQIVEGDISTQTVVTFTNTPIPEPATGWLVVSGLAFWALRRKLTKRPFYAALFHKR